MSNTPRTDAERPTPPHGWVCFHCDETFTDWWKARDHFGETLCAEPACQIEVKQGLARRVRIQEALLARYRNEDTDLHREIHALTAKHYTELIREEEKGYARGLQDYTKLETELAAATARLESCTKVKMSLLESLEAAQHERDVANNRLAEIENAARFPLGLSDRELQSLHNLGNECETAAAEIVSLRLHAQNLAAENLRLREALTKISTYPRARSDELGYRQCMQIAAEAISARKEGK